MRVASLLGPRFRPPPRGACFLTLALLMGCNGVLALDTSKPRAEPAVLPALVCGAGASPCGGACVASTDPANCGRCGQRCIAGEGETAACIATSGGATCLVCAPGRARCGEVCVDPTADDANCGACGHGCGGQGCEAGRCLGRTIGARLGDVQALTVSSEGTVYWTSEAGLGRRYLGRWSPSDAPCDGIGERCFTEIPRSDEFTSLGVFPGLGASARYVYLAGTVGMLRRARDQGPFAPAVPDVGFRSAGPLRVAGDRLVWSLQGNAYVAAAVEGGPPTRIMENTRAVTRALDVAIDGDDVFATPVGSDFAAGVSVNEVKRGKLHGSCVDEECATLLATGTGRYGLLAVQGAWVYVLETVRDNRPPSSSGANRILRVGRDSLCSDPRICPIDVVVADVPSPGPVFTADPRFLFWIAAGALRRVPIGDAACPEADCLVASGLEEAVFAAAGETAIYVGLIDELHEGRILRFPK